MSESIEVRPPLTESQTRVLEAIEELIARNGFSPTLEEIGEVVGFTSKSTVYHYVQRLRKLGYLSFQDSVPRTLRVL